MSIEVFGDDPYKALANENDRLLALVLQRRCQTKLLAELYQVLGALDAPAKVLDQVFAAAQGNRLPHATLLPFFLDTDDCK